VKLHHLLALLLVAGPLGCGRTETETLPKLTMEPGPIAPNLDDQETEGETDGDDDDLTPIQPPDDITEVGDDDTTGPDGGTDDPDGDDDAGPDDGGSDGGTGGDDGGPDDGDTGLPPTPMEGDLCDDWNACTMDDTLNGDLDCVGVPYLTQGTTATPVEFGLCNPNGVLTKLDGQVTGLSTSYDPQTLEPGLVVEQCVVVDFSQVQPVRTVEVFAAASPTACSVTCTVDEDLCYGETSLVIGLGVDGTTWTDFAIVAIEEYDHDSVPVVLPAAVMARFVLLCKEQTVMPMLDVSLDHVRVDPGDTQTCWP